MKNLLSSLTPTVVALFWGAAFVLIKVALESFAPTEVVALRFLLASAGFGALYAVGLIRGRRIAQADLPRFLGVVAAGMVVYHLALVWAETQVPAGVASLVGQAAPLIVLALAWTNDRRAVSPRQWAGVALAGLGAASLVTRTGLEGALAWSALPVLALTPVGLALFTIWSRPLAAKYGSTNLTAQAVLTATPVFLAVALLQDGAVEHLTAASTPSWMALLSLAGLSTVAGYTLWFAAIAQRGAAQVSLYLYLVPVVASGLAWVVLGEGLDAAQLAAAGLVLVGVFIANRAPQSGSRSR